MVNQTIVQHCNHGARYRTRAQVLSRLLRHRGYGESLGTEPTSSAVCTACPYSLCDGLSTVFALFHFPHHVRWVFPL